LIHWCWLPATTHYIAVLAALLPRRHMPSLLYYYAITITLRCHYALILRHFAISPPAMPLDITLASHTILLHASFSAGLFLCRRRQELHAAITDIAISPPLPLDFHHAMPGWFISAVILRHTLLLDISYFTFHDYYAYVFAFLAINILHFHCHYYYMADIAWLRLWLAIAYFRARHSFAITPLFSLRLLACHYVFIVFTFATPLAIIDGWYFATLSSHCCIFRYAAFDTHYYCHYALHIRLHYKMILPLILLKLRCLRHCYAGDYYMSPCWP